MPQSSNWGWFKLIPPGSHFFGWLMGSYINSWSPLCTAGYTWVCLKIVYPYTQWFCWSLSLLNGYNWWYTPFSDITTWLYHGYTQIFGKWAKWYPPSRARGETNAPLGSHVGNWCHWWTGHRAAGTCPIAQLGMAENGVFICFYNVGPPSYKLVYKPQ
jgi:hypothetical protein